MTIKIGMAKRIKPVGSARLTGHFWRGELTFSIRKSSDPHPPNPQKHGTTSWQVGPSGLTNIVFLKKSQSIISNLLFLIHFKKSKSTQST
jgi:hypothetical protein